MPLKEELKKKIPALERQPVTIINGIDLTKNASDTNYDLNARRKQRDTSFINDYESIADNNILKRALDSAARAEYEEKQAMVDKYNAAKARQISDVLGNYGNQDALATLANGNSLFDGGSYEQAAKEIIPYLSQNGVTEKQMQNYFDTQKAQQNNQGFAQYAEEHPILATASAIPWNLKSGIETGITEVSNYLSGRPIGSNTAVNERAKAGNIMNQTARENLVGNAKTDAGKFLGGLAYDAASSTGDYISNLAMTGFNPVAALALMGYKSAAQSLNEQKGKDTTAAQKMGTAAISGAIEMLTEKIPMDNLFTLAKTPAGKNVIKQVLFGVGKQAAEEGVEEFVNEIANNIADWGINGGESDYANSVNAYMAQGMSEDQARNQAKLDVVKNAGYAGAAGALSGGVMGGFASVGGLSGGRNGNLEQNFAENTQIPALKSETTQTEQGIPNIADIAERVRRLENPEFVRTETQPETIADRVRRVESETPLKTRAQYIGENPFVPGDMSLDEIIESNAQRNAPNIQAAQEQLAKPYNSNAVDGMKEFSAGMKDFINMFGNNEVKSSYYPQLVSLLNEYQQTGDPAKYNEAADLAAYIDKQMVGKTYKNKAGNSYDFIPDSFYDEFASGYDSFNKMYLDKKNAVPSLKNETSNYDDALWERDIANATEEVAGQDKQIPTISNPKVVKGKKKYAKKNAVMAEDIGLTYKEPTIRETEDGSIILEAEVERPKQRKGSTSGKAQSANNSIVSQLATNTYNNGIFTSNAAQNFLQNEIQNGTYNKKEGVISEKESVRRAKENVNNDRQQVINRIEKVKHIDGVMLDEAMTVLKQEIAKAEQTGNWDEVRRLSKLTQEKITDAARAVQANAKYTRNAAGAIMRTQRLMDDYGIDKNISNEDYAEVNRLFKEAEKVGIDTKKGMEIENKAYAILAKYLPDSTFLDKWNAWRYLAMLGNTRTHIRNFIGNTLFGTITNIKDSLAGAMEAAFIRDSSKRTKSALVTDGQLLKDSRADAENVWRQLTDGGTKFDIKAGSESEKRIFKNKLLEWARRFNSDMLAKEDNFALVNKYQTALAGYLQARGKDSSIFKSQNKSDIDLLKEARSYAIDEAKKATFHEESEFANWLNNVSKTAHNSNSKAVKAAGYVMDAVLPFKKTPVNVLKQGAIEYNPAQMVKGIYDAVAHGDNPSKAIDEIARGLTGTGILAFGAYLASKGILRAKGDKDNKDLDNLTGQQDFSINVDGKSYTFDWAAPAALPLFVGAELYDWSQGKGDFWSALAAIGDPVVEMSMLQGLKNTIESVANYDSEKTTGGELAMNIGLGYVSQGVPTMLGQVARAADDTRRSTYTGKSGTTDTLMKGIKKIQNKIPGLSQQNEPYVNAWGEEQKNEGGNFLGRLAYNMLSPGYYSDTTKDQAEQELYRLSEKMADGTIDNKNIIPSLAEKKYNKEQLTPEQYTEYAKTKGQNARQILNETVNSKAYSSLNDNEKAALLNEMLQFSNALSKKQMFDYDIEGGSYKKEYEAYQHGGTQGLIDYLDIKSDLGGSQANEVLIDSLENGGLSDEDKLFYFKQNKKSYSDKAKYLDSVNEQYTYDWYKIQAEYGTKKDDMLYGIMRSDLPEDEKAELKKVVDMKSDDVKYYLMKKGIK